MTSPSLLLEEYFLTQLQVDFAAPSNTPTFTVASVNCAFDYELFDHPDDRLRRMMRLKVDFQQMDDKGQRVGYRIHCELAGFFSFTDSTPKGKEELVFRVNGFNLLYGALRGTLSGMTASFPGGRFNIPSVMPNEIVADIERRRKEAQKQASATVSAT